LDELLTAVAALTPQQASPPGQTVAPARTAPTNVRYFPRPADAPVPDDCISVLEIPRAANVPAEPPLAPALREQLSKLRTTVLLAMERRQLRSVLLCSADPTASTAMLAAQLSQLLAEYERLKIAYLEVIEDVPETALRRKVLPFGYTFQLRHTRLPNLCEIASSLGTVRLTDWLKWWSPTLVMQELRKRFDIVVVSAPAITRHPDVALLAAAVDGTILTAIENVTTQAQMAAAQQQLNTAQASILGVTLEPAPPLPSALATVKSRVREMIGAVVRNP
ncbi:MAG: hypothetical protein U0Y68_26200, partial [Blastocatellia bacterium]